MPPGVRNGNHNGQGKAFFTMGMSVTYTCDPGYYLVGNAVVFCRASGNWSRPVPQCEGGSVVGALGGEAPSVALSTGETLTIANRSSGKVNPMYECCMV